MIRATAALAALAATSFAHAQSGVTLFGVIDTAFEHVSSSGTAHVNRLVGSGSQASRFGMRGVEDLGGGMTASFWLEAALATDNGLGGATNTNNQASGSGPVSGITFGRRSTVSLAGAWGEIRLGRDLIPGIMNVVLFDPFLNQSVGASQAFNSIVTGPTALRASNSIMYFTPANLGGFYVHGAYWLGENASNAANADDGTGGGVRVGFARGPFEVAASMNRTQAAAGDIHEDNVGGAWKVGPARITGSLSRDRNAGTRGRGGVIGATIQVGPGDIRIAYSQYRVTTAATNGQARKLALGYGYNLSKRTTVYATIAGVRNSAGFAAPVALGTPAPVPGGSSSGFNVGVRHAF
jgi:predicted porin